MTASDMDRHGVEPPSGPHDEADTVPWSELLRDTADLLRTAGVPNGEVDARRMVADAAGVEDRELAFVLRDPATVGGVTRLRRMAERRMDGEPLQYVLGHWPFRSLDLMVDRRVLIPRPETEAVVTVALEELDRLGAEERPTTVVDLGTGSGAIALAIAVERVRTTVWATDVSASALDVARANLAGTGRVGARVRIEQGRWFAALPDELRHSVDVVVSNPPYVAESAVLPSDVVDWEPASALFGGPDGLDDVSEIVAGSADWLVDDGAVVCELSPEQGDAAVELAERHFEEVRLAPDLAGRARAVVARRPLGR